MGKQRWQPSRNIVISIFTRKRLAELANRIAWSHTRKPYHTRVDQSPRTESHSNQRLLLVIRPISCDWYKLPYVDENLQITCDCRTVHPNTDFLQFW